MLKETILHAGIHKTGSTTIQNCYKGFSDGENWYLPTSNPNRSLMFQAAYSESAPARFMATGRAVSVGQVEKIGRSARHLERRTLSTARGRLLISAENFGYFTLADCLELASDLSPKTEKTTVMAYIREPFGFSSSFYQEKVKAGNHDPFHAPQPDYRSRLEGLADVFGDKNVVLRSFDEIRATGVDLLTHFSETIQFPKPSSAPPNAQNASLSLEALSVLYRFNRVARDLPSRRGVLRARKRLTRALSGFGASKFQICPDVIAQSLDANDHKWLENRFGLKVEPREPPSPEGAPLVRSEADILDACGSDGARLVRSLLRKSGARPMKGAGIEGWLLAFAMIFQAGD